MKRVSGSGGSDSSLRRYGLRFVGESAVIGVGQNE